MIESSDGKQAGDPDKLARLVIEVLASDPVPLRLPVGADAINAILAHLDTTRDEIGRWESRTRATDFTEATAAR